MLGGAAQAVLVLAALHCTADVDVLRAQFIAATHPWTLTEAPHVHRKAQGYVIFAAATYNGGVTGLCMTTTHWPCTGSATRNLYHAHPDVNCYVARWAGA